MKWKKLDRIFNPTEHGLDFAQSPQAIVLDDRVRIYFSTRIKDESGKFLSNIAFVDMTKDLKKILSISKSDVIELGGLGTFDEHGIFPISPVQVDNKIFAYTTGWSRRVSVSVETSIGFAVSDDNGLTFKKNGSGPILSSTLNEPFLVGDAFVKSYDDAFHMWYIYGTHWKQYSKDEAPDRVYKIGYAQSQNGLNWEKEGKTIISDFLDSDECQALPTVFKHNNLYHMYFCYRNATGFRTDPTRGYRLGYAYSSDKRNWTRDESLTGIYLPGGESWDSRMMCYPNVFECDGNFYLLYNGNEFGKHGFGAAVLEK